jgi:hypothetical protein
MKSSYAEGCARFFGRPIRGEVVSSYSAGIDAAQYRGGDPDKWERNLIAKMCG